MHPADRLSCHIDDSGDAVRLIAVGELDYWTREAFDEAIQAVLTRTRAAVLDLTGLRFISSEGMASLIDATNRATATGTHLTIVPSLPVHRRLDLVGLTTFLNLTTTDIPTVADPPTPPDVTKGPSSPPRGG